jgi:hypothetical protein
VTQPVDPRADTWEFAGDDAGYLWWRNAHPWGFVLGVRARKEPLLHRATCADIDRDRKPGALRAAGSRQICGQTPLALREWLKREVPGSGAVLPRCPKCSP